MFMWQRAVNSQCADLHTGYRAWGRPVPLMASVLATTIHWRNTQDAELYRVKPQNRVQAWDVRNSCKQNGAVLPLPSAPEGRGADGVDAMA
jgi:hypothetical protein